MAIAYYATKISDNISKTPEGFLIAHNVPVGRTGWQEYASEEIDEPGIVQVWRDPKEVFHPATVASVEGKDITDLHPSQLLDPNNHASYSKGHAQNSRKGTGEDDDKLLADLHIKDASLISKVENGQREVSLGYICDYSKIGEGKYEQKNIRINHIAIVPHGRAGTQVAIRDHKPEIKKETKMAFSVKHIFGLGLKEFAKDAEPEEVAKAFEATSKGEARNEKRNEDACTKDVDTTNESNTNEHAEAMKQILEEIKGISARMAKLETSEAGEAAGPEESLDAFVKELEEGKKEETGDAELIPVETLAGEELPTNPIPGADSNAAIAAIKAMRPVIAAMPDGPAKRKACDALIASFKAPNSQKASYGDLLKLKQAQDAKRTDDTDFGKSAKEKFHRKNILH